MLLRVLFEILNPQLMNARLMPMLLVIGCITSRNVTPCAEANSIKPQSTILIARKFDRNPEYPAMRKTKSRKQALASAKELTQRAQKIERRINELEVLEPVLKAEVLTVTKMAAKATRLDERKIATKRIRDAENDAIAVIRELKALRREFDAVKGEAILARNEAGLGTELAKLGTTDNRVSGRIEHLKGRDEWRRGLSPEGKKVARKIKRKIAKRISPDAHVAGFERRTTRKANKGFGKRTAMRPISPLIKESEFDDILGAGDASSYEKALDQHFNAFITLLDSIMTPDANEQNNETDAQEEFDEARKQLIRTVRETDKY